MLFGIFIIEKYCSEGMCDTGIFPGNSHSFSLDPIIRPYASYYLMLKHIFRHQGITMHPSLFMNSLGIDVTRCAQMNLF